MTTKVRPECLTRTYKFYFKKEYIRDYKHLALLIKKSQDRFEARKCFFKIEKIKINGVQEG